MSFLQQTMNDDRNVQDVVGDVLKNELAKITLLAPGKEESKKDGIRQRQ